MAPIRNGEGEKLKLGSLGVIEGYRGSEKSRFERGDIENGGVEGSSVWIIDRVEGNIRERDRNGKQDELIGKIGRVFVRCKLLAKRIGRIIELREYWKRRVVWMEEIREKFGLTREVNHCKTN